MLHPSFVFHFAYLDPGTGSMLVQSFVGVLAGVSVFGRRVIINAFRKVKSLFTRSANAQSNK
ncbi:MAG TPA: hypothetical protein VLG11_04665 [Candidatus Saccharimonadales bacterium]|nr:hypothetical protein [Candidatus Saccharimonadales bacterium]